MMTGADCLKFYCSSDITVILQPRKEMLPRDLLSVAAGFFPQSMKS